MQIWVDADACPKFIKNILFRAAERLCTNRPETGHGFLRYYFVSNRALLSGIAHRPDRIVT
jgi:hypothetical protein